MTTTPSAEQYRKSEAAHRDEPQVHHRLKKDDGLQVLRAVAALLVVYAHSIDVVKAQASSAPRQIHFFFLENFGACGVDIFFAISGFILSTAVLRTNPETDRMALDFIARRYIRIFPIYWIVTLIPLALSIKHHVLSSELFFSSMLLLPSLTYPMLQPLVSIAWTLIFEMFFYYVLSLNLLFGRKAVVLRTISCIVVLVAAGAAIGFRKPVLILIANPMNIEFAMGCCIALVYTRFGRKPFLGAALMMSGGGLLASTVFFGYKEIDNAAFSLNGQLSWYRVLHWGVPSAILTAGLVFRSASLTSAFGRFWVYLGDASYSIYLTSLLTLLLYERWYRWMAFLPPDLSIFMAVAVVVAVGTATYLFVEKPVTRIVSDAYRRHGAPPVSQQAWSAPLRRTMQS